jgi:hypothetical protein
MHMIACVHLHASQDCLSQTLATSPRLGEGFSPDYAPDQWLVEMSGIPYGMHAEQLTRPNLWRGMVFAEGARPAPGLWVGWDEMGLTVEGVRGFTVCACVWVWVGVGVGMWICGREGGGGVIVCTVLGPHVCVRVCVCVCIFCRACICVSMHPDLYCLPFFFFIVP